MSLCADPQRVLSELLDATSLLDSAGRAHMAAASVSEPPSEQLASIAAADRDAVWEEVGRVATHYDYRRE